MYPMYLSLVAGLAASAVATPWSKPSPHEKRDGVARSWQLARRAAPDFVVPVRIGMKQRNLDEGGDILMDIADQRSPRYGQWWTAEQVHDFFAPVDEHVDAVNSWLTSSGIHEHRTSKSANKQWIQFDAEIHELESLLKTKYHMYEHEAGHLMPACDEYHVPGHLGSIIDYITPGVNLPQPSSLSKRGTIRKGLKLPIISQPLPNLPIDPINNLTLCGQVVTPACIKEMYNITTGQYKHAGNELGIFEDLDDHYDQTDLNLFFQTLYPTIPQGTHPKLEAVDGAIGPGNVTSAGPESNLDFQISYPIIWPQQSILFQTDDENYESNYTFDGFLNTFLDAIDGSYCSYTAFGQSSPSPLDPSYPDPAAGGYKGKLQCGVYKPTNVISISYGGPEILLSTNYQRRQCNEYMKLGMQGVSVVIASGDNGVDCDPYNTTIFSPDFPVTCPYVTAVGSTTLPIGEQADGPQEGTTQFGSGGGFSNIFPRPSYQNASVNKYLAANPPPFKAYQTQNNQSVGAHGGVYNSAGRAYPDVAAIGQNVLIFTGGTPTLIGGTSAAAPVWGAILTRINEFRFRKNMTSIGFINPTIYANPSAIRDVVTGSNPGTGGTGSTCNTPGFQAAAGWDPVSGLGVPKFRQLANLFLNIK